MRLYAYKATTAGIARLQRERQPTLAIEPVEVERSPEPAPEPVNNVVQMIPRTKVQQIIADVAKKHGLSQRDLTSPGRSRHIVLARDEAIAAVYALKVEGDKWSFSSTMIGRLFGCDHTSILTSLRRTAKRRGL